jgi:hypothetical protein
MKNLRTKTKLKVNMDYDTRIIKDSTGLYYVLMLKPLEKIKDEPLKHKKVLSIDPGVRTLLTGYDKDGKVIEFRKGDMGKIFRLLYGVDKLQSKIYQRQKNNKQKFKHNHKRRKNMKKAFMSSNTRHNSIVFIYTAVAYLLIVTGLICILTPQPVIASSVSCPITIDEPADVITLAYNDQIEFSQFSIDTGSKALITVTNNTNCAFPLSLGAYEVYDQQPSTQDLFDSQKKIVPPHSNGSLLVDLPNCLSQIDLYHDPDQDGPPNPPTYANPKLIGWTFQLNKNDIPAENDMFHFSESHPFNELDDFPQDDDDGFQNVPVENRCSNTPPLQAQCSVSPSSANLNDTVTWSSSASGGSGAYSYEWTGNASGYTQSTTATYTATGTKQATVTIEDSSGNTRSAQCDITVSDDSDDVDDQNDGDFNLSFDDPFAWLVSNSSLRSTKADIDLTGYDGFNEEVTLTAASLNFIDNEDTKFVLDDGTPQETITLQPEDFSDPLEIYVRDNIDAATYPVTVTANADGMPAKQKPLMLYVRSVMEF